MAQGQRGNQTIEQLFQPSLQDSFPAELRQSIHDFASRRVVSTGTPPGVGMGMEPETYLKEGDLVELGIDQLGSSAQKVLAPA